MSDPTNPTVPVPVADPGVKMEVPAPAALNGSVDVPMPPPEVPGQVPAAPAPVGVEPAPVAAVAPPVSNGTANTSNLQVHLPLEEFAEDLDLRLGRANGNIYQRRQGVEGIHDGQVMVRLKKKRFIVIDYGIVPHEHDLQHAAMTPHISVPLGAGVTKCTGKVASEPGGPLGPCKKVGVPVLLYDSEPDQPASLYLRSGLCFVCQRQLNEKRRTQRKRPSDRAQQHANAKVSANAQQSQAAFLATGMGHLPMPNQLQGMQTVRIGGIGTQANLVGAGTTGRVNATPHHRVLMAVTNGHKKIKLAHTNQPLVLAPDAIILNGPPDNHSCKSVRQGHGFAEIGADLGVEVHQSLNSTNALLHSVNTPEMIQQGIPPPTPDEISRTYDQAFYSLSKSLYLLVQWKTSWDAAIASAMQQETAVAAAQAVQAPPPMAPQQHPQAHMVAAPMGHAPPPHAQAQAQAHAGAQQQQQQQQQQQHQAQQAAALQAASMANAAATAAIGGMINGVPGSVPVGIAGVPVAATPLPPMQVPVPAMGVPMGMPGEPASLAHAVASAAAVAAVSHPANPKGHDPTAAGAPATDSTAAPLDQSVEV